jgi:sigma-E factor negative regulatory protein RseA
MVMDRLSALMDGELDGREAQSVIVRLKDDSELRIRWDDFHLVRDALRGEPMLSSSFNERLSKRLADEPTVLAPRRLLPRTRRAVTYTMSAAASVAAAALVLSVAMSPSGGDNAGSKFATVGPALPPAPPMPASLPYDGNLNELLLAHQIYSPSTALQGVVGYIRTVTPTHSVERR